VNPNKLFSFGNGTNQNATHSKHSSILLETFLVHRLVSVILIITLCL